MKGPDILRRFRPPKEPDEAFTLDGIKEELLRLDEELGVSTTPEQRAIDIAERIGVLEKARQKLQAQAAEHAKISELAEKGRKTLDAKKIEVLEKLVTDGKITPEQRDVYLADLMKSTPVRKALRAAGKVAREAAVGGFFKGAQMKDIDFVKRLLNEIEEKERDDHPRLRDRGGVSAAIGRSTTRGLGKIKQGLSKVDLSELQERVAERWDGRRKEMSAAAREEQRGLRRMLENERRFLQSMIGKSDGVTEDEFFDYARILGKKMPVPDMPDEKELFNKVDRLLAGFREGDEREKVAIQAGVRTMTFAEISALKGALDDGDITPEEQAQYSKLRGEFGTGGPSTGPEQVLFQKVDRLLEPARDQEQKRLAKAGGLIRNT